MPSRRGPETQEGRDCSGTLTHEVAQASIENTLKGDLTEQELVSMKARLLTEAGSLAHKKWSKREISLTYRNLEIKLMADTVAMEIDLRCAACLKSRLAVGNLLLGMEFENDILRILDGTAMNSTNTHDNRGGSEQ